MATELKNYIKNVLSHDIDVRSREYVYILYLLENRKIKEDELMIVAIDESKQFIDLVLLGFALRYGANRDLYVDNMHILGYASKSPLAEDIILMMTLSGSNIHSILNIAKPIIEPEVEKKQQTVHDYLSQFPDFDHPKDNFMKLPLRKQSDIATFLDKPDLINNDINYINIIMSHCQNVKYDFKGPQTRRYGDIDFTNYSIDYGYSNGVKQSINNGYLPSYYSMNRIILNYQLNSKLIALSIQYETMIRDCIQAGVSIDTEQMAIITLTNPTLARKVIDLYSKPLWEKVCSNNSEMTPYLRNLSFNFNIVGNKKDTCSQLQLLSMQDNASIKRNYIQRQKDRVKSQISVVGQEIFDVECYNRTILLEDPLGYNDTSLSFYRDGISIDDPVYCFTSDMYDRLLDKNVNPYTLKPLPELFKQQIKNKLNTFNDFNIAYINPVSIDESISELKRVDKISGKESQEIVNSINQVSIVENQNTKLELVPVDNMNKILAKFNMDQSYLPQLTRNHQIITFSRAVYDILRANPSSAKTIFLS